MERLALMIPYDKVDKTNWIQIEIELDEDLVERIKVFANYEKKEINDFISQCLYEGLQIEMEKENLENNDEPTPT